jgi:hypothetical protein
MMLNKLNWLSTFLVWAMVPAASVLAQSTKPVDPVMQQLTGQWQGTLTAGEPSSMNTTLGFMFAPSGKAVMFFPESTFPERTRGLMAASIEYAIDSKPKPMHIDFKVVTFDKPVLTIFDLPNPQTLKLQIEATNPGKPRPKEFKQEGLFQKVSDSAIVPLTQLAQAEQSKQGEGEWLMKSLAKSALLYKMSTNQFPTSLEQLGLSKPDTQHYRVQLATQPNQLTLVARAKKAGLKSYTSMVVQHTLKEQGKQQEFGFATVCQSFRPSLIAPPLPTVTPPASIQSSRYSIQCGSGSESVKF